MPTAAEIALLNSDEINPDRNKLTLLQANFFRGEDDGKDYCKVVNMHDQGKNEVIQLVNALHIRRWPRQWEAYQHGRARAAPDGTSLRKVIGLDEASALVLKLHNVHSAEALATLDDAMLMAVLGDAGQMLRASAKQLLRAKRADELEAAEQRRVAALAEATEEPSIPDVSAEAEAAVIAEQARLERVRDLRSKQEARK